MVINIFCGSHFSHVKLLFKTNRYFHNAIFDKTITDKEKNYAIRIQKHSVKIILANDFSISDTNEIRKYIETVFQEKPILIDSVKKIEWLNNIKNVSYIWNDK